MNEKDELERIEEETELEAFKQQIEELFEAFTQQNDLLSEKAYGQLKEMLAQLPMCMNSNTYIKVLYMLGRYYDLQDNRNAARYCALRMLQIKESMEKKRNKALHNMELVPFETSTSMNAFLHKYTDFLRDVYHSIRMKMLIVSGVLLVVAFFILRMFAKVDLLLAFLEALVLSGLNYYIQGRKIPSMFQKNQLRAIEQYVDSELLSFDSMYFVR